MATGLNMLSLMKQLSICSKKITTYTKLINNISHFLTRLYYHLMNILKKIKPGLINLITKNHEVELNVNLVYRSKTNPYNECNIFITSKSADIDEVFDLLIKKSEDLKIIVFLLKDVESITYSFTKIIVKITFIESRDWIKNKNMYDQSTKQRQ